MDDLPPTFDLEPRAGWLRVGVLRPLASRDFRLLWAGRSISLLGDGIFTVAVPWQVLAISNSPGALAAVGVAWTVPLVAFLVLGGVVADRFERRRVMLAADLLRGLAVGGLGALSLLGVIELWHVLALSVVFGVGEALFYPAFGGLVPELVPPGLLVQANSLDGLMTPLGQRLLGPAAGGLAIAALSVGGAFLLDAASFACSIAALLAMRRRPRPARPLSAGGVLADIREGLRFVRSQAWLFGTLLAAACSLLVFFGPWQVLLPYVVKNRLHEGAGSLGLVYAAGGAGAVLAALAFGQRELPRRVVTFMYVAWALGVAELVAYGLAGALWQLVAVTVVGSALSTAGQIAWTTLVQREVPGELLGRVTSFDWFVSSSLVPASFALTGPVAAAAGAGATLVGAGALGAAILIAFVFLPGVRDLERGQRR